MKESNLDFIGFIISFSRPNFFLTDLAKSRSSGNPFNHMKVTRASYYYFFGRCRWFSFCRFRVVPIYDRARAIKPAYLNMSLLLFELKTKYSVLFAFSVHDIICDGLFVTHTKSFSVEKVPPATVPLMPLNRRNGMVNINVIYRFVASLPFQRNRNTAMCNCNKMC